MYQFHARPIATSWLGVLGLYCGDSCRVDRDSRGAPMSDRIRGVNLSGWFILEPWVTPSLFAATGASNDGELQQVLGAVAYNERVREHYETFISEADFKRMSAMGLNAVRIPLPWHVFGSQTDRESYISCIDYIDRALEWAEKYEMRVLLDLATVPGGQGDANGSSVTPDIVGDWHSSVSGRAVALETLERLAERYGERDGLLGIELLDSPVMSVRKNLFTVTEGIPSHYLRNFYCDAYEAIRRHMPSRKVIVFSDSGHPGAWKRFMAGDRYQNVVMDLHLYHFRDETAQDITTPRGLAAALGRNKDLIRRATDLGFPVFVGEWSGAAVLAGSSLTPEGRRAYERVFVSNQLATFDDADGWFFQTWKTERRIAAWDARVALAPLERAMME